MVSNLTTGPMVATRWTPGPTELRLDEGAVDVWRAKLTGAGEELAGVLSVEERRRAALLKRQHHRERWIAAHGVLRILLGRYLDTDPSAVRFAVGARGKPAVAADVSFNMSHSGELALYGFTSAGPIGVDVEVGRRPIDEVAVAGRILGPAEAARLHELEPKRRREEFLRVWTRHEASVKCQGGGIGVRPAGEEELWVAELDLGEGVAGAVATARPAGDLRCWQYLP